ncbi:hypothetical protein OKJ48_35430 [Streptomyces kunmingensis]|uniref:Uncharacterized protein n=1 Tax=Streptomyces kunmingensis TaxID=68225 RepID=A0ABU6CL89_9ACTN|nr:hypothetical protein [Streptomyces kunmingensis]MEB3965483.1 hypothetical protein [Streptomyces kunmingensis]
MSQASSSAYERLRAAAAQLHVPDAVRTVAGAAPGDPRPGQIWRAVWEGVVEVVAITAVDDTTVHALPVSLETRFNDPDTVLLPAEASTLEQPLALWCGLGRRLPWYVLDRQVSELSVPLEADGSPVPDASGYRYGSPLPSPASQAAEFRSTLADTMDVLATARWAPRGSGGLPALLKQRGLGPTELIHRLSIKPPRALALLRAQTPLTPPEAHLLAPTLGMSADAILAANPPLPDRLLHELSRPARREQIRRLAHLTGTAEQEARRQALFATLSLAARQERPAETDWPARVDRYFQVHLGPESE